MQVILLILMLFVGASIEAVVTVKNRLGGYHFLKIPEKIIVLDWTHTENLLELGIIPIAISDKTGYMNQVKIPELPAHIQNIGSQSNPDLQKIATLKPDLIIGNESDLKKLEQLKKIAPTILFKSQTSKDFSYNVTLKNFNTIAHFFKKDDMAKNKLQKQEEKIKMLQNLLKQNFRDLPPKIVAIQMNQDSTIETISKHSFIGYTIKRLGLNYEDLNPSQKYEKNALVLNQLDHKKNCKVLILTSSNQIKPSNFGSEWNSLTNKQKEQFIFVEPVWTEGGPISIMRVAEIITQSIIHSSNKN